ncbi:MAG: YfiR family protein [Planctomycetota bacterium]|jgi:hypothetical protein
MKTKTCILILITALLTALPPAWGEKDASTVSREYQLKAAFLYNFLNFVEWPEEKVANSDEIIIGIIGKDPFGGAFETLKNKKVKNKKVVIKKFRKFKQMPNAKSLQNCYLLFICPSERENAQKIIETVGKSPVLTVGEQDDFLKKGGIINFYSEENKISFEINRSKAKKAGITIRSRLLRLAKNRAEENNAKK